MLRIGLTGGIGSGKSTVATLFAARGVPVIDTDDIARTLVEPGQAAYADIVKIFGQAILESTQKIDRKKLRELVFKSATERKKLEAILHPRIREELGQRLRLLQTPYCLIVVPLLIESGFVDLVDRILVIDADEEIQIQRTAARSGMSAAEIQAIMAAQMNRVERRQTADDVILNNSDKKYLEQEVAQRHAHYLSLATAKSASPKVPR